MTDDTKIDDGGQAFPAYRGFDARPPHVPGQTLRDYFAAKAIQGYCANPDSETMACEADEFAQWAYKQADAMLIAAHAKDAPEARYRATIMPTKNEAILIIEIDRLIGMHCHARGRVLADGNRQGRRRVDSGLRSDFGIQKRNPRRVNDQSTIGRM